MVGVAGSDDGRPRVCAKPVRSASPQRPAEQHVGFRHAQIVKVEYVGRGARADRTLALFDDQRASVIFSISPRPFPNRLERRAAGFSEADRRAPPVFPVIVTGDFKPAKPSRPRSRESARDTFRVVQSQSTEVAPPTSSSWDDPGDKSTTSSSSPARSYEPDIVRTAVGGTISVRPSRWCRGFGCVSGVPAGAGSHLSFPTGRAGSWRGGPGLGFASRSFAFRSAITARRCMAPPTRLLLLR